jgi:hypothetical protein
MKNDLEHQYTMGKKTCETRPKLTAAPVGVRAYVIRLKNSSFFVLNTRPLTPGFLLSQKWTIPFGAGSGWLGLQE